MVSNLDINWKGEEPVNPKNIDALSKRALRKNPGRAITAKADELIITAEKIFRNAMAGSGVINLAEKEPVISSGAYQNAQISRRYVNFGKITPENYRLIDYRDKAFFPALAQETGFQRSMFVEFEFTTDMANGLGKSGTCRADLEMTVLILDARGKILYRKVVPAWSRETVKVLAGAYPLTEMMGLFSAAIDEACFNFLDFLVDD